MVDGEFHLMLTDGVLFVLAGIHVVEQANPLFLLVVDMIRGGRASW